MEKLARRRYTLEYKREAIRLVSSGLKIAAAKALGIVEQTRANWVKAVDSFSRIHGAASAGRRRAARNGIGEREGLIFRGMQPNLGRANCAPLFVSGKML